jgi:Insertion element 4 transposase N-terminal
VAGGRFAHGHLGELTQLVPFEMVDEALARTRTVQSRIRDVLSRVVVYLLLAACLFPELGYPGVWRKLTAGLEGTPVITMHAPALPACRQITRRHPRNHKDRGPEWLRSRLRRPPTRAREFARPAWSHPVGAVACSEDHSVHLPDHGLLGRQIEPGGGLPASLHWPAAPGVASCREKKISVGLADDINFA